MIWSNMPPVTGRISEIARRAMMAVAGVVWLASCAASDAGASSAPMLSPEQKMALRLASVTAESGPFAMMETEVLDRIVERVKSEIRSQSPDVFSNPAAGAPPALTMKMVFTEYRGGGVASKTERRNAGLIQIEADVLFVDPNGKIVAKSRVATHFGSGGDVGLSTNVLNVEYDFENAVARLVR
jgi:hypothetical protein